MFFKQLTCDENHSYAKVEKTSKQLWISWWGLNSVDHQHVCVKVVKSGNPHVDFAGDAQLLANVRIEENVSNWILMYLIVYCTKSPCHECHMSFCMIVSNFGHHRKKSCRDTLFLINVQLRSCPKLS